MSTILLNTPDSSSRDSSTISSPAVATLANAIGNMHINDSSLSTSPTKLTTIMTTMAANDDPNNNNSGDIDNDIDNNNAIAVISPATGGLVGTEPASPRASDTAIVVPRRIFVGGFPPATTEHELRSYFEQFGSVRDVKIIRDSALSSTKGRKYSYGFVTFETDDEAKKLISMGKDQGTRAFEFRGRYLNVNEAVKKPPFNKVMPLDAVPPNGVVLRDVHGQLFTIQNGYAIIANPDAYAVAQPQPFTPTFPFVVQHPVYFAATAPPAPVKYTQQHHQQTGGASSYAHHLPPTPASAPILSHVNNNGVPGHMQKARFVFPPMPPVPHPPFNGSHVTHLPPTPLASPVNADSPSKNMVSNFNGNNPAITNLTNPFPTVLGGGVGTGAGGSSSQQMPPSPYRWTTSTIPGPVTQLVYPGAYPTFVQDVGHSSYPMHPHHQHQPQQHHGHQQPPQQLLPSLNASGNLPGFYSSEFGDYGSCSAIESLHEVQPMSGDRRQQKNHYRMESTASLKD